MNSQFVFLVIGPVPYLFAVGPVVCAFVVIVVVLNEAVALAAISLSLLSVVLEVTAAVAVMSVLLLHLVVGGAVSFCLFLSLELYKQEWKRKK